MSNIKYVTSDGIELVLGAGDEANVMQVAVRNGVQGIIAECGGQAMCATCHIYVDPDRLNALPSITEDEDEMLDCTATERKENSRLSCQVPVVENLTVYIPDTQV